MKSLLREGQRDSPAKVRERAVSGLLDNKDGRLPQSFIREGACVICSMMEISLQM